MRGQRKEAPGADGRIAPRGRRRLGAHLTLAALLGCLLLLPVVAGTASAAESSEFSYVKRFGPDGTEGSGFGAATSIAVDQSGEAIYVLDCGAGSIFKFDLDGSPVDFSGSAAYISGNAITGLAIKPECFGSSQVAVDSVSHKLYVTGEAGAALQAFQSDGEPALFTAGPGAGTNSIAGGNLQGVAVDKYGYIYGSDTLNGSQGMYVYAPSGAFLTKDLQGEAFSNIAIDGNGTIYEAKTGAGLGKRSASEFPPNASTTYTLEDVNGTFTRTVGVDPGTNELYVDQFEPSARIAVFAEDGSLQVTFAGAGEDGELGESLGVGVHSASERVFVSNTPAGGLSQVEIFQRQRPVAAPGVDFATATEVTADSATLRAEVNPNTLATSYRFEYGLGDCAIVACASVPAGEASVGSGHNPVVVSQGLTGLQAGTTYHFRVVAKNALDTTSSPDRTFTTQASVLGFLLSDSRAWEMVSPAEKFGGTIVNYPQGTIRASVDGNGLAYLSRGSIEPQPEGNRSPELATDLSRRDGGSWHSEDLTPPHSDATPVRGWGEYSLFTPDLSLAGLNPHDDTPLSPAASELTPYLRTTSTPPVFTPLVTSKEPYANVPPGTQFGEKDTQEPVLIEAASPDLNHVVIRSQQVPLTLGAQPNSIYMWEGGALEPVSQLPAAEGGAVVAGMVGSGQGSVRHAVSDDGTRVFWSLGSNGLNDPPALYLRDTQRGETFRLDLPKLDASGDGEAEPSFQGASEDGEVVFFTDSQQLTADASLEGRDLYRCEIGAVGADLGCASLIDLSAPSAGESADVLSQVAAFSEDGRRLYFVARGVLSEVPNGADETAAAGQPNLYFWEEGKGLRFIAGLSEEDFRAWGGTTTQREHGYAADITAMASPGGRYFAFTSVRSLTGYENRNGERKPNVEVYLYDAQEARLICASCNPSGAAAVGVKMPVGGDASQFPPVDQGFLWAKEWVAAILPEASVARGGGYSFYRSRAVLDNGRVFFNSVDPLVAADSNGRWDVYQYQPFGTGSCASSTGDPATARSGPGCVGLVSSGRDQGDSSFLDASQSGDDVFFTTSARLSALDRDDAVDIYDARVNGVVAQLPQVSACAGEACQPNVGAPNDPTAASESFHGSGNPFRCPKSKRRAARGRLACVRRHHESKKRHHRRASKKRGAQR